MNRSSMTPATFIATPWIPAGSPKRNSDRITVKSGRQRHCPREVHHEPAGEEHPDRDSRHMMLAMTVPIAAPWVPYAGIGPAPLNEHHVQQKLRTVIAIPRRKGVRASPAARSAPPSMKNISRPMLQMNIVCRNGSASARTAGVALTRSRSVGDEDVTKRREHCRATGQRGDERLVHGAVDPVVIVGAGERATSTPMPVNSELMKTMTTRKICQLTPIAAFPV